MEKLSPKVLKKKSSLTALYKTKKIYRTMEKIQNRRINFGPKQNDKLELFLDDAWFTLSINANAWFTLSINVNA